MKPQEATTLFLDCGTMVGHQQTELELVSESVPFFGLPTDGSAYFDVRLSNGLLASFRAIYRSDNGMWRIELSDAVPEICAGVFPAGSRRSNYAAVFTKVGDETAADFALELVPIESPEYEAHLAAADRTGDKYRTQEGPHGRNYGWY